MTVTVIATWKRVPNRIDDIDFFRKCPFCGFPSRVRLGAQGAVVEVIACAGHYVCFINEIKATGILRFVFSDDNLRAKNDDECKQVDTEDLKVNRA